ncbi:MAG: hypothetical protein JEZ03_10960 [Bacteroidales bacterium]|nr:hypothetical protein [Bacteroidales bacterium]
MQYQVEDPSGIIDFKLGKSFGTLMAFAGYPVAFFGILGLFSDRIPNLILGIVLLIGGMLIATSREGIQIDLLNNSFREYTLYFFSYKGGKWRSLYEFTNTVVLRLNESQQAYSITTQSIKYSELSYNVYFMDENHIHRVLIRKFDTEENAMQFAFEIAKYTELAYAEYNPATRRRR